MSNARNLANLLGTSTTVPSLKQPAGTVLQIQRTQFTSTNTYSSITTDTVITDLTVNITPISTSSIIKIEAMVNGEWSNQSGATDSVWFFYRNSTKLSAPASGSRNVGILMGTALTYTPANANSTPELAYYSYFDAPSSTSQITYKVGVNAPGNYNWSLNKTHTDTDSSSYERGISFISVTEFAG